MLAGCLCVTCSKKNFKRLSIVCLCVRVVPSFPCSKKEIRCKEDKSNLREVYCFCYISGCCNYRILFLSVFLWCGCFFEPFVDIIRRTDHYLLLVRQNAGSSDKDMQSSLSMGERFGK